MEENSKNLKKVMIIDDDITSIYLNGLIVNKGYGNVLTVSFTHATHALTHLTRYKDIPDLILLDLNLPDMSGFEFSEKLDAFFQENPSIKRPTLYVVSNHVLDYNSIDEKLNYNFVKGVISKPLNFNEFKNINS